jgi:nitroreductase
MNEMLDFIKERRSLRVPFDMERPVAKYDLEQILEAARWTPTAHNMQNFEIIVIDDKKILDSIANIKRPISETFIRENYPQLSFSEEELLKRKVGILGNMFPPAWRTPDFKLDNLDEKEIASMQRPFPSSPLMLVIVYNPQKRAPASEGDFLGIISLGCAMENMWLTASSLGIGFHILSSLSSENVEDQVKNLLNIPKNQRIAFTCRLGYPKSEPPKYLRVRRNLEDFVHQNKW